MPEQSRRSFLKFLGIGGGIAIGGQEIKRFLEKSVSTRYARYFFIPEVHSRPASPDLFPSQVDCIYKERVGPIDVISAQMYKEGLTIDELKQEVEIILTRFDKIPTSVMTDEDWSNLLNELKQERELLMQGKKLAWGDIGVGSLGEYFSSRDPKDHFFQVKMALTLNALSMLITGIIFLERKKKIGGIYFKEKIFKNLSHYIPISWIGSFGSQYWRYCYDAYEIRWQKTFCFGKSCNTNKCPDRSPRSV